jgi:hypothetical protein
MGSHQPVESLFKQIQDCADYSEAGVPIIPSQHINVGYAKIFATGQFMSACRRWNEKRPLKKLGLASNLISPPLTANTSR